MKVTLTLDFIPSPHMSLSRHFLPKIVSQHFSIARKRIFFGVFFLPKGISKVRICTLRYEHTRSRPLPPAAHYPLVSPYWCGHRLSHKLISCFCSCRLVVSSFVILRVLPWYEWVNGGFLRCHKCLIASRWMSRAINIDASPLKRRRARPPEEDVWSRAEAQITCSDTDNLSKNMQNITTLLFTARVDNQPSHPCHHCGKKHKGIRKAISSKYWNTTSRMMGNRAKLAQQTTSEALQSNKEKLLTRRINSRCFFSLRFYVAAPDGSDTSTCHRKHFGKNE